MNFTWGRASAFCGAMAFTHDDDPSCPARTVYADPWRRHTPLGKCPGSRVRARIVTSTVSHSHPSNPEIRLASDIAYQPSTIILLGAVGFARVVCGGGYIKRLIL